ncbi:MAG: Lrp/AsnC family transcriptional regulator [Alphaproteobacteria bacterium]
MNADLMLDDIDRRLIEALQDDARLSYRALGRRIGLSQPAVADRVRRLEEAGVVQGYRVRVDRGSAGLPITAFLRVTCAGDRFQAIHRLARELPAVLECHHVSGEACFMVKVAEASLAGLERTVERFREHGETVSSVVLSSVVEDKPPSLP